MRPRTYIRVCVVHMTVHVPCRVLPWRVYVYVPCSVANVRVSVYDCTWVMAGFSRASVFYLTALASCRSLGQDTAGRLPMLAVDFSSPLWFIVFVYVCLLFKWC